MSLSSIRNAIKRKGDPKRAVICRSFFKTGKGEYGEGDCFVGVSLPELHAISDQFSETSISDLSRLLKSKIHEERLAALLVLVRQYRRSNDAQKRKIYHFYLKHAKRINNWDLVDSSAHHIVGEYLSARNKKPLYRLARSKNLWEKRISIVATWYLIRKKKFSDTLKVSKILMNDKHDLIHKAVGWMLREVGKKDEVTLKNFLKTYYEKMPRTMLRYAIERFPISTRKRYLTAKV